MPESIHPCATTMAAPLLALVLGLGPPCEQQGSAPASGSDAAGAETPSRIVIGHVSLAIPDGWRRLTPDEGRELRARHGDLLPGLLADNVLPGVRDVLGPVARWESATPAATGFAHVQHLDEEAPAGAAGLDELRGFAAGRAAAVPLWDLREARVAPLGPEGHRSLFAETVFQETAASPVHRMWQFFAPTGGRTVVLSLVAGEETFAEVRGAFEALAASARLARAPRDAEEGDGGGSRLTEALLWGAAVGLVLAAIHRLRRRSP